MKHQDKQHKVFISLICVVLLLLGLGGIVYSEKADVGNEKVTDKKDTIAKKTVQKVKTKKQLTVSSKQIPTLFVHGNGGGEFSLSGMIDRYTDTGVAEKALKIRVAEDGDLDIEGELNEQQKNPLIHIIFEENLEEDEAVSSVWVANVVKMLKKDYGIQQFYGVGHSNGGPVLLRYAIDHSKQADYPKMLKLASIGGPMNGEFVGKETAAHYDLTPNGPLKETARYTYFREHFQQLDVKTKILNIAGDIGDGRQNDGSVTMPSVFSIRNLAQRYHINYQEKVFMGSQFNHSYLHESSEVDQVVAGFLWVAKD